MNLTFSSNNVKVVSKHSEDVGYMFNFPDNDDDHLISISVNGQLNEWVLAQTNELSSCNLERPGDNFLINIGHQVCKNSKLNMKISHMICFDNFIVNGYEDGLILVWNQKVIFIFIHNKEN
jgi:hypothetical protein